MGILGFFGIGNNRSSEYTYTPPRTGTPGHNAGYAPLTTDGNGSAGDVFGNGVFGTRNPDAVAAGPLGRLQSALNAAFNSTSNDTNFSPDVLAQLKQLLETHTNSLNMLKTQAKAAETNYQALQKLLGDGITTSTTWTTDALTATA